MMWLALLFIVVPTVELYLLLQIGATLGPTAAFLLVVVTGIVGGWLAKQEGLGVLSELQQELARGIPPGDRMMEGVMVLAGGLLLVTPGVLTDLVGFSLIFPVSRKLLAPRLLGWLGSQVNVQVTTSGGPGAPEIRYRNPQSRPTESPRADSPFANKFDDLP